MAVVVGAWVGFAAIYLLFAGSFDTTELCAAGLVGLAGSLWLRTLRQAGGSRQFVLHADAARALGRGAWRLPIGTVRTASILLRALFHARAGRLIRVPFVHGQAQSAGDAGRRAVAVIAASLAPDGFVLRLPDNEDRVELHDLARGGSPTDPRWLM